MRSWFRLARGRVLIEIADRGAAYPLRVDPFVQQGAKLTGSGEVGNAQFGSNVALSSDGNTALVGGPYDNSDTGYLGGAAGLGPGAAWVFTRSGSTWTQQGNKLTPSDEIGDGGFGSGVALSSDGNTALIGGSGDGAAWVFTRSGSTWTQQGTKLTGTGEIGNAQFGSSVALSSDGNTALIGGDTDDPGGTGVGAAWVFARSGSTWTQQGNKLTGSGEIGNGRFGLSVALSSDGNTALIGGPNDNSNAGAAWVFVRSGSIWTQQGSRLTGGGEVGDGYFGSEVALSADGNTALIGGPNDNLSYYPVGAAWVFVRSGSTWTQQGTKLTPSDEVGTGEFGYSVALSADGNTALIGSNSGTGAAWVFARSGSTWTQQGNKLTGSGETAAGHFGSSVALSSDGNTALIGEPDDPRAIDAPGAAQVFVPGHGLTVAKSGTGSGTVTSSPTGISCGRTCSAAYLVDTRVILTARPAAGSVFSGWSGGGCSGKGTCTVTLSSDRSVVAKFKLKPPKITKAEIDRKHHTARFKFKAAGASGYQCALVRPAHRKKHRKPHFTRCQSPKTYKHLKKGKYTFEVRALAHGHAGPATRRRFSI
jgi:hypothetical protein